MIKGLYTAATGMTAQQYNIDVISNNIANDFHKPNNKNIIQNKSNLI